MSPEDAVVTLENGNISDFKVWLKAASKLDMLRAIEYYSGNIRSRHILINHMMVYLEEME